MALPRMGEAGAMDLAAERQLGDRIAQQIYRDPDYLDDPVLDDHLQSIWQPLLAAARARGELPPELAERFAWELMLSRERTINAFALPGAYFGVNLGLVAAVSTPDELASVLAHEMTHVCQRHISRLIARQDQQAPWLVGAMILGALAANAAKNTDVVQAAVVGGQAVAAQTQLNFSRDMEREADRIGFGIMTGAGFEGQGFVSMFDKLQQASRLNDDGSFPYLRSHPLTSERIADMKARLTLADAPANVLAKPVSLQRHAMMSARARVLAETDPQRWQSWVDEPALSTPSAQPPSQALLTQLSSAYAAALSARRLNQPVQAMRWALRLRAQPGLDESARQAVQLLVLEIELMPKNSAAVTALATVPGWTDVARGLPALAQQSLAAPERAAVLLGAQVMLKQRQAQAVSSRLQVWVADHPKDEMAWLVLSQAWTAQHQPLRAIRAEAEARVALLDVDGAVDRLRSAREWAQKTGVTDDLELSIIDARYRELRQRQRELTLAQKP
jgi:predicted Zn-dependent protease